MKKNKQTKLRLYGNYLNKIINDNELDFNTIKKAVDLKKAIAEEWKPILLDTVKRLNNEL